MRYLILPIENDETARDAVAHALVAYGRNRRWAQKTGAGLPANIAQLAEAIESNMLPTEHEYLTPDLGDYPTWQTLHIVFEPHEAQDMTDNGLRVAFDRHLNFLDVRDDAGNPIEVGTWVADGEYEELQLTLPVIVRPQEEPVEDRSEADVEVPEDVVWRRQIEDRLDALEQRTVGSATFGYDPSKPYNTIRDADRAFALDANAQRGEPDAPSTAEALSARAMTHAERSPASASSAMPITAGWEYRADQRNFAVDVATMANVEDRNGWQLVAMTWTGTQFVTLSRRRLVQSWGAGFEMQP